MRFLIFKFLVTINVITVTCYASNRGLNRDILQNINSFNKRDKPRCVSKSFNFLEALEQNNSKVISKLKDLNEVKTYINHDPVYSSKHIKISFGLNDVDILEINGLFRLYHLESFNLQFSKIGDNGAAALAKNHWPHLISLNLCSNKISAEHKDLLRQRFRNVSY